MDYLYTAGAVRKLEASVINELGLTGYELMHRAGQAVFRVLNHQWPEASKITVLCGKGKNGGDGFILAGLAQERGFKVNVIAGFDMIASSDVDARQAREWAETKGVPISSSMAIDPSCHLIVDAMIGIGFKGKLKAEYEQAVELINLHPAPVLSIDVPTGVSADAIGSVAKSVRSDVTVTFIGRKLGLHTGVGAGVAGKIIYETLGASPAIFEGAEDGLPFLELAQFYPIERLASDEYKHSRGHLVVVGGDHSMGGAAIMAGESALRAGAGLVTIVGRKSNRSAALSRRPEIMYVDADDRSNRKSAFSKADGIVVGPGLGEGKWGLKLLRESMQIDKPLVLDADALKLLGDVKVNFTGQSIVTPHVGEASIMLGTSIANVQEDRLAAAESSACILGGICVLKGPGSIVASADRVLGICKHGNPGMATAGMGDVLSGILGAMVVQGMEIGQAAKFGTCLHSAAADIAAKSFGERGMLATDLFLPMTQLMQGAE